MKRFLRDTRGYALVLTLVFLPAFLGITLLMIDIGRGNNAQTDHQAAADALALAAARELDGGSDAIIRAQAAMENVTNTVAYLARSGEDTLITLDYPPESGVTITVIFLRTIPASDDDPINQAWVTAHGTTNGPEARYAYVRTQARDLDGFFFNPLNFVRPSTPVGAQAVATYRASACNVTPLFICNPFEKVGEPEDALQDAFLAGELHGRMIKLRPKGNGTAFPGNFGFLDSEGADLTAAGGARKLA
jgi:Flp pilus assembly protein TadG